MITFEEAVKIAKKTRDNVDYFSEYKDLYVFGLRKYMGEDRTEYTLGGWDMPFIVLKSNGKVMGFSDMATINPQKLYDKNFIKRGDI